MNSNPATNRTSIDEPAIDDDSTTEPFSAAAEVNSEDDPRPPMRRLEAVLFLAREPLTSRKISQLAGLSDGTQARTLIRQLNQYYDQVARSFHVKQLAGGYQMRTRPQFSRWLRQLPYSPSSMRLTSPSMETLAVVAYRQPVLKSEVEAIRGVACGELLRQLLDRGLVKVAGRSEQLGNPYLYATTKRFLELFGLASLDALPRNEKLRDKSVPEPPPSSNQSPKNHPNSPRNTLDERDSNSENHTLVESANPSHSNLPNEDDSQEERIQ